VIVSSRCLVSPSRAPLHVMALSRPLRQAARPPRNVTRDTATIAATTERSPSRPRPETTRGGEHIQAYTVEQVAEMLHIGRDKVYYLLRTGQLRSIKIGKSRRITNWNLAEFIVALDNDSDE